MLSVMSYALIIKLPLQTEFVYRNMWPYLNSYRLMSQSAVDSTPVRDNHQLGVLAWFE